MVIKRIQPHLKRLCKQLGSEYRIVLWDLEYVITRDFDNGFSVEISGLNSSSTKNPAQIYLWDLRDDSINQYGYRNGVILRPSLSSRRTSLPMEWNGYTMSPRPCWGLIHAA